MDLDKFLAFQGITKQQYDALEPKNQKTLYNDYLNANPEFEVLGYSKDIWFDGKYYGSIRMDEKDREQIGYHGRRFETLESNLKIKNKRIIKAGSEVMTEIFPINGKLINKQ